MTRMAMVVEAVAMLVVLFPVTEHAQAHLTTIQPRGRRARRFRAGSWGDAGPHFRGFEWEHCTRQ